MRRQEHMKRQNVDVVKWKQKVFLLRWFRQRCRPAFLTFFLKNHQSVLSVSGAHLEYVLITTSRQKILKNELSAKPQKIV